MVAGSPQPAGLNRNTLARIDTSTPLQEAVLVPVDVGLQSASRVIADVMRFYYNRLPHEALDMKTPALAATLK